MKRLTLNLSLALVICIFSGFSYGGVFVSHSSGDWEDKGAVWTVTNDADSIPDGNDTVTIAAGTNIDWGASSITRIRNLNIDVGGTLTGPNNNTFQLKIYGDYVNNGTESSRGLYSFQSASGTVSGSGSFSSTAIWNILGDLTVGADATIAKSSWTRIYYGSDLVILGDLTFNALVRAEQTGTIVSNFGTLTIGNQTFLSDASGGTFVSNNVGSTTIIDWVSGSNVNIPIPSGNEYFNLTISGTDAVRATASLTISGDLTINDDATFNMNNSSHILDGDYTNNGGTLENGVDLTFSGSGTQNINSVNATESFPCPILIGFGSSVDINCNIDIAGNLTLLGTLDATTSNNDISLTGNWQNSGTFVPQEGNVTFNGTAQQTVDGGAAANFYDITCDNSNGVLLNTGTFSLTNTLFVDAGTFDLNGNTFTILSASGQTGRIGPLCSTCAVSGTVTMQRFIDSGSADFRDIASPFLSNSTFAMWDNDLLISGPGFTDGCAFGGSGIGCYVSCKFYDASSQSYEDISALTDEIENLRGYEIFMGDDFNTFSGTTLNISGDINGPSTLTTTAEEGWNLIGNPFCSEFDYDQLIVGSNISNFYYIYDNTTGGFEYYDAGSGTSSGTVNSEGVIASSQGFWVFANSGGAFSRSLNFPQTAKRFTTIELVKAGKKQLAESVEIKVENLENHFSCKSTIHFNNESSVDLDDSDVPLFMGPEHPEKRRQPMIWFTDNNLRFNSTPVINSNYERYELTFDSEIDGEFKISAQDQNLKVYSCVILYDSKEEKYIDLKLEDYTFDATAGDYSSRFELIVSNGDWCEKVLKNDIASSNVSADLEVQIIGTDAQIDFLVEGIDESSDELATMNVYNLTGQMIFSSRFNASRNAINADDLPAGTYVVEILYQGSRVTEKFVKVW